MVGLHCGLPRCERERGRAEGAAALRVGLPLNGKGRCARQEGAPQPGRSRPLVVVGRDVRLSSGRFATALIAEAALSKFPCVPLPETLTRSVTPDCRSRTKASGFPLVSAGTRLLEREVKATYRPSALIPAAVASPFPNCPELETATRTVWPAGVEVDPAAEEAMRARRETASPNSVFMSPAGSG